MYKTNLNKFSKIKPLTLILGINKIFVYCFKGMLFYALSTAALQQALASQWDWSIDYIEETSIDEVNEMDHYKIVPQSNSVYFRLVNSAGKVLQNNLYDVQPYENNYIVAKKNGYYGVINSQGDLIFNFEYDDVEVLKNNLFILTTFIGTNKANALVSRSGHWIYPTDLKFDKGLEITPIYFDKTNNISYFKVYRKGKYGVIDDKGNVTIPLIYDEFELPDEYGFYQGAIKVRIKNKTGLIDHNNNYLVPLAENQQIEPFFYKEGLFKISKHLSLSTSETDINYIDDTKIISEYVVDLKGNKLVETDSPFESEGNIYKYSQDGKYGLLSDRAEILLNAQFDAIDSDGNTSVIVTQGNKHALAIKQNNGEWLVHNFYDSIDLINLLTNAETKDTADSVVEELYIIGKDQKFGVINKEGKLLIPIVYDEIESLGSLLRVKLANKYGLKTQENKDFIELKYDDIQSINVTGDMSYTDAYLLSENNLQTIIDTEGQVLIPRSNIRLIKSKQGFYMDGIIIKDGKYGVYDFEKKEYFLEPKYEDLVDKLTNGLYILQLDGKKVLLNEEKALINSNMSNYSSFQQDYETKNIKVVSVDDKYGMMNETGEIFIPAEYDYIEGENLADAYFMFVDPVGDIQEVFITQKDGFLGVLDKQGNIVIPFEYTLVKSLRVPAYLAVSKSNDETDNSVGLMNTKGELLLNYQYNRIFNNTEKMDGRIYAIESKKKIVDTYDSDLDLIDTQDLEEFKQVNSWIE